MIWEALIVCVVVGILAYDRVATHANWWAQKVQQLEDRIAKLEADKGGSHD